MGANPNTFEHSEDWAKAYQVTHHKLPVYPAVANYRLKANLQVGDTVNRNYRSSIIANDMGGDGSYVRQAVTDTKEQLVIDQEKEASFYIKDLDELQSHLPTRMKYAYDSGAALHNQIDADVLGAYGDFNLSLDDGDIGGTAGNGITVATTNVSKLFSRSLTKMQRNNIKMDNNARFTGFRKEDRMTERGIAIITPDVYQILLEYLEGKETALGDNVGINGHKGRFFGFDLFVSNNIAWSGVLAMATNPTDGDTVVINGVTFTFKDTLGTTAGNVHIGTAVDDTRANFAAALNAPTTDIAEAATTGFVAFDEYSSQHLALRNLTATNDNTADTLTVVMKGRGFVPVDETFTDGTDEWTAAKEVSHCLFGVANAIDLVIQKAPNTKVKDRTGYVGNDIVSWAAYGQKVFNESLNKMVDVQVRTDALS